MTWRLGLLLCLASAAQAGTGYDYTRVGNSADVATVTQGGILFAGGGTDVDDAFRWMCAKANGGDFLVIRASGTDAYNPYIRDLCPALNSVATLIIHNRAAAQQPFVKETILKAEAIFLSGGDQSNYVKYFADGPVAEAIDARAAQGVPVGGTSAGNAVLAQFGYSAFTGSVKSKEALADPFTPLITIEDSLFKLSPLLRGLFTDDHFKARDRMGRLIAFLARETTRVSAIATDEETAYLMEPDGNGKVVGNGAAYFLRTPGPPEICKPHTPLTYKNIAVYRVREGGTFNVANWKGTAGAAYELSASQGVLESTQSGGSIY